MSLLLSTRPAMADIGRVGCLDLRYRREGPRTILAASRCSTPWHLFPPAYLDESGCAFTSLVNPSGGFVAGDHLSIHAVLEEGAHVVMSTPSANRVYRSLGEESRQFVTISVAPGAVVEWFPEVTIPFAGSRFVQTMAVTLATGATALIWDSLASGRVAREERWAFTSLRNAIHITTASGGRLLERYEVRQEQEPAGLGLLSAYDYVASFFCRKRCHRSGTVAGGSRYGGWHPGFARQGCSGWGHGAACPRIGRQISVPIVRGVGQGEGACLGGDPQ